MLSFFSSTPDHPLADAKEAKTIFQAMATREPGAAIQEATALLESLVGVDGFKLEQLLALVFQLDETAILAARRLGREYATAHLPKVREQRLFEESRDYWAALIAAYEDCLRRKDASEKIAQAINPLLPQLYVRLLNAVGQSLKWGQFRYGPIDGRLWQSMGRIYLDAVARKMADKVVAIYPGSSAKASPAGEYLSALVFQASSMDNLLPVQIEIAEHLIAHFLPHFVFTAEVRPDNVFWVDAAKPAPPARLARPPEISPTLRFFNSSPAVEAVEQLKARIAKDNRIPPEIVLGGTYTPDTVVTVLEHLAMCWSPKPPMRGHTRHRVKSRLSVAHGGLADIYQLLASNADCEGCETWVVDDVSQGGMGAKMALGTGDWVRIGSLICIQPEGAGNWLIGAVRRFSRESESVGSVGIETLSRAPRAILADAGGLRTECILLDVPKQGETVRVAMSDQSWEDGVSLLSLLDGVRMRLFPEAVTENCCGIIIARYFVQQFG